MYAQFFSSLYLNYVVALYVCCIDDIQSLIIRTLLFTCRESNHYNQCDAIFAAPYIIGYVVNLLSRINPVVAHQVNLEICHAFLKRHQLQGVCVYISTGMLMCASYCN